MESCNVSLELLHDLIREAQDVAEEAIIELDYHTLELKVELIDVRDVWPLSPVVQIYIYHGHRLIVFE